MSTNALETLKKPIRAPKPIRVLINAGATAAFYDIEDDNIREKVIARLVEVCRGWRNKPGTKFLCSFDDDLLMTGGTDFHGSIHPDIEMGSGKGGLFIPYELYDQLAKS